MMGIVFLFEKDFVEDDSVKRFKRMYECVTFINFETSVLATILRPITLKVYWRGFIG